MSGDDAGRDAIYREFSSIVHALQGFEFLVLHRRDQQRSCEVVCFSLLVESPAIKANFVFHKNLAFAVQKHVSDFMKKREPEFVVALAAI